MDNISKSIQANNLQRESQVKSFTEEIANDIEKGKALPIGTTRMHGNKKVIKTATGWKPHTDGKSAKVSTEAKSKSSNKSKASSKASLYKQTGLKPGSVEEFEDDEMREQLTKDDIKAIVDAEKSDVDNSKDSGFKFSDDKKSFQESVSRMRSVYDGFKYGIEDGGESLSALGYTEEQAKEKMDKMDKWFTAAKQHSKTLKNNNVKKSIDILIGGTGI